MGQAGNPGLSDDECRQAAEVYIATGRNQTKASEQIGISRAAFQNRLKAAARRGFLGTDHVLPGYQISKTTTTPNGGKFVQQKPEPGEQFTVPEGQEIKGVSAYVDADGRIVSQWIKTREGSFAPEDLIDRFKDAVADYVTPHLPVPPPSDVTTDLLNFFPSNDWHLNLRTWASEVGENWNLEIAERIIGDAAVEVISRSPRAGAAIILDGGDGLHSDNNLNRTAKSGNVLDADDRHHMALEAAFRLKVRQVDTALLYNERVVVRILRGNHDEYSAVAIAYFLFAYYRNEPRVTVDVDHSLFFWFRFHLVLIGATHGHTVKLQDMAQIMAHRRAEDWGQTRFRYIHGFHVHHKTKFVTEGEGVVSESHQAPIPMDAWHFGSGFVSGRSITSITYHGEYGEIGRVRKAILDAS